MDLVSIVKKAVLTGAAIAILYSGATGCKKGDSTPAVDNPPLIISYEIPDSVLLGNDFHPVVKAADDKGILEVYIEMQAPNGLRRINLQKNNGSWEGTAKLSEEGSYPYKVIAKDTIGQTVTVNGSIACEANKLTVAQAQQLTSYLEELSRGWHQPSVGPANDILKDESLGPQAWELFFQEYFSTHPFTNDLRNYLGYPVYWWFSETAHANLQQGLYGSLTDIITSQTGAYLNSDRSSLTRDSPVIQSLTNSHRFLNDMIRLQAPGVDKQQDIFNFYRTLAEDKGLVGLIYGNAPLDIGKYPFAGAFRAQAHINLVDALTLTDPVRDQIIDTLKLDGIRRDIFKDYGVLVTDNQGLDTTQLQVVKSILDSVPSEMYNLRNITVNEFLGNINDQYLWFLNDKTQINIPGPRVSTAKENVFPSDVLPRDADIFNLGYIHELNHVVDAHYIEKNDLLRERKIALLKQAGSNSENYLRSMFKDGFFQNAPQEFFASISAQWFADSEHTLSLGLERFNQGKVEPLNQFLFFADVYSRRGSSTLFYMLDTSGNLTRREIQIGRDTQGRITELYIEANQYKFQLDGKGNVLSVNKLQANP